MRKYMTVQGDTWDKIAHDHYGRQGRELLTSILIQNNPQYIDTVIFPPGCVINIPDIQVKHAKSLPPWMT